MIGECLCRRVRIEIGRAPAFINICNCRFCRSSGAAFAHYAEDEVQIDGATQRYRREDLEDVWLAAHFCPTCGSMTHYTVLPEQQLDRVGVNMRLFAQDELEGIEVRYLDGRAVETEHDEFLVTATGRIGDGTAF